jgi:hypothetical protein
MSDPKKQPKFTIVIDNLGPVARPQAHWYVTAGYPKPLTIPSEVSTGGLYLSSLEEVYDLLQKIRSLSSFDRVVQQLVFLQTEQEAQRGIGTIDFYQGERDFDFSFSLQNSDGKIVGQTGVRRSSQNPEVLEFWVLSPSDADYTRMFLYPDGQYDFGLHEQFAALGRLMPIRPENEYRLEFKNVQVTVRAPNVRFDGPDHNYATSATFRFFVSKPEAAT